MNDHVRWLLALAMLGAVQWGRPAPAAEIEVSSVLIKLLEQVEVPAREAGVLDALAVREGQMVESGAMLAQIDDADVRYEQRKAELELVGASKLADNDVKVRFARKSSEVAEAELRRAIESERRLAESVSASEMDQLRLLVERSRLEIEQAEFELDLAQTTRALKDNDVQIARHDVERRKITSPLAGFVAQVYRQRGEWVQPGQPVVRLLRLDRLRAEGLVAADVVGGDLLGRPVTLSVRQAGETAEFVGEIVYVSPEVDPVNGQVRVWAEIDNADLKLRPGLHGSLVIAGAAEPREP